MFFLKKKKQLPLQGAKERDRNLTAELAFFLLNHLMSCFPIIDLIVLMVEKFIFSLSFLLALIYAELI